MIAEGQHAVAYDLAGLVALAGNQQRVARLDEALRRTGVDTVRLSTVEPFAQALQRFFETRRWRRA